MWCKSYFEISKRFGVDHECDRRIDELQNQQRRVPRRKKRTPGDAKLTDAEAAVDAYSSKRRIGC